MQPLSTHGVDADASAPSQVPAADEQAAPSPGRTGWRWWMPAAGLAGVVTVLTVAVALGGRRDVAPVGTGWWWVLVAVSHVPFVAIVAFLAAGIVERVGYFRCGRRPAVPGRLPEVPPTVCVQLPIFNEHEVARRAIEAACALDWPRDRFHVQVLDDSTDPHARALVEAVCAAERSRGIDCRVLRREHREGYKAGALEAGRRATDAEYIAVFDADFLPPSDFLRRTIAHFYVGDAVPRHDLALVQAQWGHLNHDESALTRAQSLWVDDHHTVQMSWRAARFGFVNFTGTAGVWRASAIERAGGWRASSLVEDCELSFRHLFAGYRTTFVKEIVAPAELPATYTAYKAQQKRWTQGWVQLQRLHLRTLAVDHPTTPMRRLHLLYHMCIPWQWPLWALWIATLPMLVYTGSWLGALGTPVGLAVYLAPMTAWLTAAAVIASVETRHTYAERLTPRVLGRRITRVVPYALINTGMLPHQFSAFCEGLFGPLHSEFERTPKAATITAAAATESGPPRREVHVVRPVRPAVKVHRPYVVAEAFVVVHQLTWAALLATGGLLPAAVGSSLIAACILGVAHFYGDHVDRRWFVVPRRR
jgi:cellulose synthase/poly-beta-1,6-N-acetylglucosamine synthase-like glycosyltransferase